METILFRANEEGYPDARGDDLSQSFTSPLKRHSIRGDEGEAIEHLSSGSDKIKNTLPPEIPSRIRKRKKRAPHRYRAKRHRPRFGYVELLNLTIGDASRAQENGEKTFDFESTDEASSWTSAEKIAFFNSLSRFRQHGLRGFYDSIPSKSDAEVIKLQQLLKENLYERKVRGLMQGADSSKKLLPAFELGQECCEALEDEADAVACSQWRYERQEEELRFGKFALLIKDTARELESRVDLVFEPQNHGQTQQQNLYQELDNELKNSASLLHLENWLELSERIFMNAHISHKEQLPLANIDDMDCPAIFATAFNDFSTLARSVTKRLVSTAIFHATSRLRATDIAEGSRAKPYVRKRDVLTALDVLHLKSNSRNFWRVAARRLGLEIFHGKLPKLQKFDSTRYKYYEQALPYDEVERQLGDSSNNRYVKAKLGEEHEIIRSENDFESSLDDQDNSDLENEELEFIEERKGMSDAYEEYLEAQDRLASTTEEQRMWNIIAPGQVDLPQIEGLGVPTDPKKITQDSKEWRDCVDFRAEWERYGERLRPEKFFEAMSDTHLPCSAGSQYPALANGDEVEQ